LPWEVKKPLTIMSFSESMTSTHGQPASRPLGPKSLRREAASLSALYFSDLSGNKNSIMSSAKLDPRISVNNKNRLVSMDMSLLEDPSFSNSDLQKYIKAVELQEQQKTNSLLNQQNMTSKFLPNRPGDETETSSMYSDSRNSLSTAASPYMSAKEKQRNSGTSENMVIASVQRPDLIGIRPIDSPMGERSKSTSGNATPLNGSSNGKRRSINDSNTPNSQQRRSVTESPATATLTSSIKNSSSQNGSAGSTPPLPPNGQPRPAGMLQKMSSFFARK
jgi:hypothetical protein